MQSTQASSNLLNTSNDEHRVPPYWNRMLTKSKSEWSNHKKLTRAETINNCKMWFCPKWDNNQILSNQYQVYDIKQPYLFSTNLINKWKFNHWGSFSNSSWWTSNKYDFALKKKINIFHGHWGVYFLRLPMLSIPTLFYPTAPCFQMALLG